MHYRPPKRFSLEPYLSFLSSTGFTRVSQGRQNILLRIGAPPQNKEQGMGEIPDAIKKVPELRKVLKATGFVQ